MIYAYRHALYSLNLALALATLAPQAGAANLVTNGDFEAPVTATWSCFKNATVGGWANVTAGTTTSGSCYTQVDGPAAPAYSGQQSMYLNDSGVTGVTLSQAISVTAGTPYQLSFALTGLTDRPTLPVVEVDGGAGSTPATFTGLSYGHWNPYSYAFTPSQTGLTALTFKSVAGFIYLDAVNVSAVPEAGSWALFAMGLAAVGVARQRRTKPAVQTELPFDR
jgi:MYXO-CTERM domain-containing protein